jgi:hypothetical protein
MPYQTKPLFLEVKESPKIIIFSRHIFLKKMNLIDKIVFLNFKLAENCNYTTRDLEGTMVSPNFDFFLCLYHIDISADKYFELLIDVFGGNDCEK